MIIENYEELNEYLLNVESKNIQIEIRLKDKANKMRTKLKYEKDFKEKLLELQFVKNYKTIKKSIKKLRVILEEC